MHLLRLSGQRGLALQPNSPSSLPSSPCPLAKGVRKDALPFLQLARVLLAVGRGQGGQERVGRSAGQGRVPGESHDRCISGLGRNMPSEPAHAHQA